MEVFQIVVGLTCLIILFSITMSKEQLDSEELSRKSTEAVESEESDESEESESDESKESDESEESNGVRFCRGHGICVDLEKCEKTSNRLKIRFDTAQLEASKKFCKPEKTKDVCCPVMNGVPSLHIGHSPVAPSQYRFALPMASCGRVHVERTFPKIVGGRDSEVGAWPWLALFAYDLVIDTQFMCSGALITNRHVITAAHCILFNLIYLRLGDFDLSTDEEAHHLDVNYTKVIKSNFDEKSGRHDLAIVILAENVEFTDNILPICLPLNHKESYVGSKPFVAGWGNTIERGNSAKILQELQITVIDNQVCHDNLKAAGELDSEDQFDQSIICAGDLEGGKDTCQGDSGGPLMMPEMIDGSVRYNIIGIVSRGIGCARKKMGGAYTSIAYHLDWILQNLHDIKP